MSTNTSKHGFVTILMVVLALVSSTGAMRQQQSERVLKTIQISNEDIIDCVDIYKQPAFDHPLMKNHTIKVIPTTTTNSTPADVSYNGSKQYADVICQECQQSCPDGTIPILRTRMNPTMDPQGSRTESVFAKMHGTPVGSESWFGGASAFISIWKPFVPSDEFSNAQINLMAEDKKVSIAAGWAVYPSLFRNSEPRSFIAWGVRTGNEAQGCINLGCPGFVQTNPSFVLGGQLPASTPGRRPVQEIFVRIKRNTSESAWWVEFNDVRVGYFPFQILDNFKKAKSLFWMGRVKNKEASGHIARTEMGSGLFPSEGYGNAAHFDGLTYYNKAGTPKHATNLHTHARIPHCYNLVTQHLPAGVFRVKFGGPGGPHCY